MLQISRDLSPASGIEISDRATCHPVQPRDQILGNLVAVGFVEQLVAGVRIDAMFEVRKSRGAIRLQHRLELACSRANGVAVAGNHIQRQVFWHARHGFSAGYLLPGVKQLNPELHTHRKAAQRISHILIHFGRIAREPVELSTYRSKLFVELRKSQTINHAAVAEAAQSQVFDARNQPAESGHAGRLATGTGEYCARQTLAMFGNELLGHGGAHRVPQQYDRQAAVFGSNTAVQQPEIVDAASPSVTLSNK